MAGLSMRWPLRDAAAQPALRRREVVKIIWPGR
jgi:hypothetical protein